LDPEQRLANLCVPETPVGAPASVPGEPNVGAQPHALRRVSFDLMTLLALESDLAQGVELESDRKTGGRHPCREDQAGQVRAAPERRVPSQGDVLRHFLATDGDLPFFADFRRQE
jgi:hypothetical protein